MIDSITEQQRRSQDFNEGESKFIVPKERRGVELMKRMAVANDEEKEPSEETRNLVSAREMTGSL